MSAVVIKICGITRVEDALAAVESGASMLGLNFYSQSPRCVSLARAQEIARAVAGRTQLAGVFVNMNVSEVRHIARTVPLDAVQLHGDEPQSDYDDLAGEFAVIRAVPVDANFSAATAIPFSTCHSLLLDTPSSARGGTGESFAWESIDWIGLNRALPATRLFLAGGLNPSNVARAISIVHPGAVDVCSGVESAKGIKSMEKMREFVAAVRAAEKQER